MQTLDGLYPRVDVPLASRDPYTHLVAVLLSAQCTDARVNKVTSVLFDRARTPAQMGQLTSKQIERIIRPCGLAPKKSKAIRGLSKILLEKHGGEIPRSLVELEELPGVGHKTAQVVLAQDFGIPTFPVDTHIHRVSRRLGLIGPRTTTEQAHDLLEAMVAPEQVFPFHVYLITHGRQVCKAQRPLCEACVLLDGCPTGRERVGAAERTL